MDILVVLENNQGSLHRLSKEAIVGAQRLGDSVSAIVMGNGSEEIAAELEGCDLEKIIMVDRITLFQPIDLKERILFLNVYLAC